MLFNYKNDFNFLKSDEDKVKSHHQSDPLIEAASNYCGDIIDLDLDFDESHFEAIKVTSSSTSGDDSDTKLIENLRQKFTSGLNVSLAHHETADFENIYAEPIELDEWRCSMPMVAPPLLPPRQVVESNFEHLYTQPINRSKPYLSKSDEDLRSSSSQKNKAKIRITSRHPIKLSNEHLLAGVKPRLTRSTEKINIKEKTSTSDDDDSSDNGGEVVSVTGIGSNPLKKKPVSNLPTSQERKITQTGFIK
jgi:hypothetical protein